MRLGSNERKKFNKLIEADCAAKYGRNSGSAWEHMSTQQKADARLGAAAMLILAQADSTAEKLTWNDAKEFILIGIYGTDI